MMDRLMGRRRMQAKDLEEIINHYIESCELNQRLDYCWVLVIATLHRFKWEIEDQEANIKII